MTESDRPGVYDPVCAQDEFRGFEIFLAVLLFHMCHDEYTHPRALMLVEVSGRFPIASFGSSNDF